MRDIIEEMAATADDAAAAGDEQLAEIGAALQDGVAVLRAATDWLLADAPADPNNVLAAATPFLRLAGLVGKPGV